MNLTCNKCNVTKPEEEFYNSKTRKTGKQPNCKTCQKDYKKLWYNEINPQYYWGKNGYFVRRYAETLQYQIDYKRADKDCKVYKLTFQDGDIYIGYTKRNIGVRIVEWKRHWILFKKEPIHPSVTHSSVFKAFLSKGLTEEQIKEVWDSVEVIKQFPGTRYSGLKAEKESIEEYKKNGYNLLNIHHNKN